MKDRIKKIRKDKKLTQVEFGERIGVKGNTITNYENGLRNPTDAIILSICREFSVNENWLRTGTGDPYLQPDDKLSSYLADIITGDDYFIKDLISAYMELIQSNVSGRPSRICRRLCRLLCLPLLCRQ